MFKVYEFLNQALISLIKSAIQNLQKKIFCRKKFRLLRLLILQMPIIHTMVFVALNIIYIEDVDTFQDLFIFFVPVIAGSIIFGVWGLNMLVSFKSSVLLLSWILKTRYILKVRMIAPYYSDYRLMGKYFALQIVLILCKLQPVILQKVLQIYNLPAY